MADVSYRPYDSYVASRDQVYQFIFRDWGDVQANPLNGAFTFRASFNGLAIAPDSDIDQVFVRYPIEPPPPGQGDDGVKNFTLLETAVCAVGRPLLYRLRGPVTIFTSESVTSQSGWFKGTRYQQYLPAGADPFAGQVPLGIATGPEFLRPFLRLLIGGRDSGLPPIAPHRATSLYRRSVGGGVPVQAETLLMIAPVFGRRSITVVIKNSLNVASYRVGYLYQGEVGGISGIYNETTITTFPGVAVNGEARFVDANLDRMVDFVTIYGQAQGAASTFDARVVGSD